MKIVVLDNYDSFTFNLVHLIRELGFHPEVHRNDKISMDEIGQFDKILLSPGPGIPDEAGIMKNLIREYGPTKSILGVCLGFQGIAEVYAATLFNMPEVLHGVTSTAQVLDHSDKLFQNIPSSFEVCHYHSWAVLPESINGVLKITAQNEQGLIMGLMHSRFDVRGVQFHPESIMTQHGKQMISNWLTD